jgi:hypothetical protein
MLKAQAVPKIGPETLAQFLCQLPKFYDEKLDNSIETSDDAAVYKKEEISCDFDYDFLRLM